MDRINAKGERMKRIFSLLMIILFIFVLVGCAFPPESGVTSSESSAATTLTDQQILEQHPDGLDEALTELEELE